MLADGPLRQAVDFAERALEPIPAKERAEWVSKIDAAVPDAVAAAQQAQRAIVKSADPDAATVADPVLAKPNQIAPSFPLFQAASRHAAIRSHGCGRQRETSAARQSPRCWQTPPRPACPRSAS